MDKEVSLLPADRYVVVSRSILTDFDRKTLMSLYAPIVGSMSISLYMSLITDLEENKQVSRDLTHHHLMSILKAPLSSIKEARKSLEAVGLLKTYVKSGDVNNYIYEVYAPLLPNEFFNHPILNVVLYNNIGAVEYEYLKKLYERIKIDLKEYQDITSQIDEVYDTTSSIPVFDSVERSAGEIKVQDHVDFDLIIASIPKGIINEKAFNKKTRELINQISYLYKIDSLKMMELIRSVLNEYGMIDKNALRVNARKMYQFNNGALPTLIYRTQPDYLKTPEGDSSMRGKIIAMFESVSPIDFLRNKYRGVKPTNRDIKLVESLLIDLEMPPAVVNVLLDYVLRKNNNKLPTNYVEAIAGQWKRAGLKTAKEAMDFAEKENKKLTKKLPEQKASIEPVWFNTVTEKGEMSKDEEEELENLLKEFK